MSANTPRSRYLRLVTVSTGNPDTDRRATTLLNSLLVMVPATLIAAALFWKEANGELSALILLLVAALCVGLFTVCRAGHVNIAVLGFSATLWILVVGQPILSGDLSTNAALVAPAGALILFLLPYNWRWWSLVWAGSALAALWLGTTDEETVLASRWIQLISEALISLTMIVLISFAAQQLLVASRRGQEVSAALESQSELLSQLEQAANTDPLTGLLNRRALDPLLDAQLVGPMSPHPTVALVDLDNFKQINDQASHAAGDMVLARLAQILRHNSRSSDLLFRLGGDEFMIVSGHGGAEGLDSWLQRQRTILAAQHWSDLPAALRPTISAGVTNVTDDAHITLRAAMNDADRLLRAAKSSGRDRIVTG